MVAEVAFLEMEPVISTTDKDQGLIELLQTLLKHPAVKLDPKDIQFEEAALLGGRLSELLPLTNSIRQRLLELKDPVKRLRNLERILDELQSRESG